MIQLCCRLDGVKASAAASVKSRKRGQQVVLTLIDETVTPDQLQDMVKLSSLTSTLLGTQYKYLFN